MEPADSRRRSRRGIVALISISDGGLPKLPVAEATVGPLGIAGDRQRNTQYHGGPDRALCIFSLERIEALRSEGHSIEPGFSGENLTVSGIDWDLVVPGVTVRAGEVVAEITGYASPCHHNNRWFVDGDSTRISQELHPGWSRALARVVKGGRIRRGEVFEVAPGVSPGG